MLPPFDVDGGLGLAAARGVSVAALLWVFGALVFQCAVIPRIAGPLGGVAARQLDRRLAAAVQCANAVGVLGLLAWLLAEASALSGAGVWAGLGPVTLRTAFGHVLVAQIVATLAGAAALGRGASRWRVQIALALATLAVVLQAGHSHASAMVAGPSVLLGSAAVHMLAAGAWLGGLPPLLMVIGWTPPRVAATAARWFSPYGKACVGALIATAAFQAWVMVGSVPGVVGTAYGWVVMVKTALFGVLFMFAVINRYRLAPALMGADPARAKRRLAVSVIAQSGAGLAAVAAAVVLSSLPPAMHEQAVWPFAYRFTLDTIAEDPDFAREGITAAVALGGAVLLLVAAVCVRRWLRWGAAAAAVVIAGFAVPHLDLFFVPAYPTSFFHSPTHFAATSIVHGAALYPRHCAVCHGADGEGDGPAARSQLVPPADLTAAHLWMHDDGELFWWLDHGIDSPEGGLAMPGFGSVLTDGDRWDLIDFLHAHNAGVHFQASRDWSPPLPAPTFDAQCMNGDTKSLSDLHGGFVRLVIGSAPPNPVSGVTTILATAANPAPGVCVADDESVGQAYSIVTGIPVEQLRGSEFLIDGDGWLRAMHRPADGPGWNDPAALAAVIGTLSAHPLAANVAHMQM